MTKKEKFKNLVEKSCANNQYVGLGNPEAKILFIGKEAGFDPNNKYKSVDYEKNAFVWKSGSDKYSIAFEPNDIKLLNGNHTWQKYQKLYNMIVDKETDKKYYIDFVRNVFTTELSNLPYPNTKGAKEIKNFDTELSKRKEIFLNTPFIKSFQIVVISALDKKYINNFGLRREIDEIFDVVFDKEVICENGIDKFWIHKSNNKNFPKLLIHTRQFTNGASNDLLVKIANQIKEFSYINSLTLDTF